MDLCVFLDFFVGDLDFFVVGDLAFLCCLEDRDNFLGDDFPRRFGDALFFLLFRRCLDKDAFLLRWRSIRSGELSLVNKDADERLPCLGEVVRRRLLDCERRFRGGVAMNAKTHPSVLNIQNIVFSTPPISSATKKGTFEAQAPNLTDQTLSS
jgi:hypothetical protein